MTVVNLVQTRAGGRVSVSVIRSPPNKVESLPKGLRHDNSLTKSSVSAQVEPRWVMGFNLYALLSDSRHQQGRAVSQRRRVRTPLLRPSPEKHAISGRHPIDLRFRQVTLHRLTEL
jgi:hypothetical protein